MDNLKFYNQFRSVPSEARKTIQAGKLKGFTDINPMWRIKKLTEAFGPCGIGWYTGDVKMWVENSAGEAAAFVSFNLYVKTEKGEWSLPVFGIGGSKLSGRGVGDGINDEAYKMAYTDALSIACKNLGMAADIYFDKDRSKYYIQDQQPQQAQPARTRKATKTTASVPAGYKPMDEDTYWKVIAAYAAGKRTKTGGDYRQTWIDSTFAGPDQIAKFDHDVSNYLMVYNPESSMPDPMANQELG